MSRNIPGFGTIRNDQEHLKRVHLKRFCWCHRQFRFLNIVSGDPQYVSIYVQLPFLFLYNLRVRLHRTYLCKSICLLFLLIFQESRVLVLPWLLVSGVFSLECLVFSIIFLVMCIGRMIETKEDWMAMFIMITIEGKQIKEKYSQCEAQIFLRGSSDKKIIHSRCSSVELLTSQVQFAVFSM